MSLASSATAGGRSDPIGGTARDSRHSLAQIPSRSAAVRARDGSRWDRVVHPRGSGAAAPEPQPALQQRASPGAAAFTQLREHQAPHRHTSRAMGAADPQRSVERFHDQRGTSVSSRARTRIDVSLEGNSRRSARQKASDVRGSRCRRAARENPPTAASSSRRPARFLHRSTIRCRISAALFAKGDRQECSGSDPRHSRLT